jgi:hypothetical protein
MQILYLHLSSLFLHLSMEQNENTNQLNIELPEEVAEGTYSNLVIISHSNTEFVLDFIRILPGVPKAKVKSRIVMTPQHAKRLLLALNDNISKFEQNFGPIAIEEPGPPMPFNFGGPTAMA